MEGLPIYSGGLELRAESDGTRRLSGRFPYNSRAVIHSGGNGRKPRKEQFAPGSLSFAINDPDRDIHVLVGHSFDKPLASKKAGTLLFNDTLEALLFDVIITEEVQRTSWWQDFLNAFLAGLIVGISPGFRVAPPEAVEEAEQFEDEDPAEGNAIIRTILAAILFELSFVTRPAYPDTQLDLRSETHQDRIPVRGQSYALNRWRA
ncbi:HK97 family phage prohead protease [Phaeovulum sp.]|uniref:HK97 family phage prohead protease n=1 Tax=Phaeovulum sp. TaxID=2934796 RepID=UPI0039E5FF25